MKIKLYQKAVIRFALVAGFIFLPLSASYAIEYGGFGGRPAYPDPSNSRSEFIFLHTINPGETRNDGVRVINNSEEIKTFMVYATDSTPSTGGAFACKQLSENQTGVGSWITLNKNEVTVSPGENEVIDFTIVVPENASVGEQNGCILVQEKKESSEGAGVNISVRTGLRVAITIPGDITRDLQIVGMTMDKGKDGTIVLKPSVRNNGNVSIDADVSVITKYFFGAELMRHGGQYPILRDQTSDWNFELKQPFWGGWYKSSFNVSYADTAGQPVNLTGPSVKFFVKPAPGALAIEIGALVLILILIGLLILSIRRKRWISSHWVSHKVTKSEDIQDLAKSHDVSWKLLAKVNDLKPPYTVHAGDVIKVPPAKKARRKNGKK